MRLALAALALGALVLADGARAQVAVVATYAPADAAQRHIVSAVVAPALERWEGLSPQLLPDDARACPANDLSCLRGLARKRGASHLLAVSVAPLGVRDVVLVVQLYSTSAEEPLFDSSVVQPGDSGGDDDGLGAVRGLADKLVRTEGPPAARPAPAPTPVESAPKELGVLGLSGMGFLATGAVGAGLTALLAMNQFANESAFADARNTVLLGGGVSGLLLVAGVALVSADTL